MREVQLTPGETVLFTTDASAQYTIIPHSLVAGGVRSRVSRRLGSGEKSRLAAIDVAVITNGRPDVLVVGQSTELTGLDVSNGRRFELLTSAVCIIDVPPHAEPVMRQTDQPSLNAMLRRAGIIPGHIPRRPPKRKQW